MPWDLDPADLAEVRRRVVDPALAALFRAGELDDVDLRFEPPDHRGFGLATTATAGPREVTLTLRVAAEVYSRHLADATFERCDADEILEFLVDAAGEWISESSFGWAEARWPAERVAAPRPAPKAAGRRVAEVYPGRDPIPVYEHGNPLDPGLLSPGLVADLSAWRTAWEQLMLALPTYGPPDPDPWVPDPSVAFSSRITFHTDEQVAAAARLQALARDEADSAWREIVELLESDRDALVERLRAELGPTWHVPTPTRIP